MIFTARIENVKLPVKHIMLTGKIVSVTRPLFRRFVFASFGCKCQLEIARGDETDDMTLNLLVVFCSKITQRSDSKRTGDAACISFCKGPDSAEAC